MWAGAVNPKSGYATLQTSGRLPEFYGHRLAWHFAHGPVPKGLSVLHKCDVRSCINPAHLFVGTQADNIHDMMTKGRMVSRARLTHEQVLEIRLRVAAGERRAALALEFGIVTQHVDDIHNRKKWGWLN